MIKLIRAEFENFRMLRDLQLQFSIEPDRNLTVIRAANESGKTTILHALQWALYGDTALPGDGHGFRLHPIDWEVSDSRRVPITAKIEFEITTETYRRASGGLRKTRKRYLLVRSTYEDVDSQTARTTSTASLFDLGDTGATPIGEPASLINDRLSPELREVFFTDGDRALSFIETDDLSAKRERVQSAIRSLLSLDVILDALKHVRISAAEANRKVKKISKNSELSQITSRIEDVKNETDKLKDDLEDVKQQLGSWNKKIEALDRDTAIALRMGADDKEKLQKDLEHAKHDIRRLDEQLVLAIKEHSALFSSRFIAADLLAPLLDRAFNNLQELHDQGKIPNTTIPVLQDRLSAGVCICGETLEASNADGKKRCVHIQELIEKAQKADKIQEIVTDLYFGAKALQLDGVARSSAWLVDYKKVVKHRDGIEILRDEAGRKLSALEDQLDSLPDTDIKNLRNTLHGYNEKRDQCLFKQSAIQTQLAQLQSDHDDLEIRRNRLLREEEKGKRILAEFKVTQDVTKVLSGAYKRIEDEELQKVSELMNDIFLEMIGSDPEQGPIIRRAEISREHDIIVYGPSERTLDPDRDLNGASRRALTLAFILALARVSEVDAPNVIDTPLGMTSGYVKRSILRTAIRESAQLILFLTHDEIAGCEDIIDENAGIVYTLTNPAHYPKMLINDPGMVERKVLRCDCNHRSSCRLCQRRVDAQADLEIK